MTALRTRMSEDMQLHGFSHSTQSAYVRGIATLAKHYHKSPDLISEDELRQYFLDLTQKKRVSREEVFRVLSAIRFPVYRACLSTIYSCGLRLSEGAFLKVQDIDSSRMMVRVLGKGSKERDVPLPERTLFLLREFWRTHRSKEWLFPARIRHDGYSQSVKIKNVQEAFRRAVRRSGVKKAAHVHSLRHSYGTHLLEAGVNLRVIQSLWWVNSILCGESRVDGGRSGGSRARNSHWRVPAVARVCLRS